MNRKFLMLLTLIVGMISFAQQEKELKLNSDTNLIEVTFYHDSGMVSQTGTYTLDGKLHGEWFSFDTKGNKSVSANYDNGKKVGKWFYWTNKTLKEVDYTNNTIVNVNEWQKDSKTSVALQN